MDAFHMYMDDNEGYLPGNNCFTLVPWEGGRLFYTGSVFPYIKAPQEIIICPSDMKHGGMREDGYHYSYTVSGWLSENAQGADPPGTFRYTGQFFYYGHHLSVFPNPAMTIAILDENNNPQEYRYCVNDTLFTNEHRTANRHSGRANVVYLDGHTGQVPGMSQFNDAKWPDGTWMFMPFRRN